MSKLADAWVAGARKEIPPKVGMTNTLPKAQFQISHYTLNHENQNDNASEMEGGLQIEPNVNPNVTPISFNSNI